MTVPHLYLDPYLFALPLPDAANASVIKYLNGILLLEELHDENWSKQFILENTFSALEEAGCMPDYAGLRALIANTNFVNKIQVQDILKIINSAILNLPTIEKLLGVRDILFDIESISPDLPVENRPKRLACDLLKIVAFIALEKNLDNQSKIQQILLSREIGNSNGVDHESAIIFRIIEGRDVVTPLKTTNKFRICDSRNQIDLNIDFVDLWLAGDAIHSLQYAVELSVRDVTKPSNFGVQKCHPWKFGKSFISTAMSHGFLHERRKAEALIRTCAETIANVCLQDTHHLREGVGAREPQLSRGEDRAWRRDIDYEYHLHYWLGPDGIELGAVVTHNDFYIPR